MYSFSLNRLKDGNFKGSYRHHYCCDIKFTNSQRPVKFNTKHITSPCHLCDPWEDHQRHTRGRNKLSVRLYFCRWSHSLSKSHLKKLPHLHRPPETAHGELRSLSPFMTSLVGTKCAAQTNVLFQSIPEWDFFSNAWKKFKNFHFQIRNSLQFLYWKRRFHDLVIWFFKSLTLCFCLNCNQKTALAYVSKGVRFLKKSPGTNGLS